MPTVLVTVEKKLVGSASQKTPIRVTLESVREIMQAVQTTIQMGIKRAFFTALDILQKNVRPFGTKVKNKRYNSLTKKTEQAVDKNPRL